MYEHDTLSLVCLACWHAFIRLTFCSTAGMQDIAADDLKLAAGLYAYNRGNILCSDADL